ncbi:MAG TPA: type I-U CRISPR-associated protein Cas7 [Firmicutes bacterium]|nr:type I-U CRISPR-associated protein Cas7 [Bacillota bacterium]
MPLTISELRKAVASSAAAFRCVTEFQPAGGPGDKIFPPTYEGGRYAVEKRMVDERLVDCVLLDSVQSQANRMELALLEAHRDRKIRLPLLITHFDHESLLKKFTVTSLEASHRIADALFRDCYLNGVIFRRSEKGSILDYTDIRNATGLFGICPTALLFGIWDSTGPRGGLGAKFQRAIVSEIIGYDAVMGVKTSSRIDKAEIRADVTIYEADTDVKYTPDPDRALKDKSGKPILYDRGRSERGKPGNPSKANHSNVVPTISDGGFTISKAVQTVVLSLAALRRLRFPLGQNLESDPEVDITARTTLAALGLAAVTLAQQDLDLRSRCQLFPQHDPKWTLLDRPGQSHIEYELKPDAAVNLLNEAIDQAKKAGLPWEGEIELTPSPELLELVRRSQELASSSDVEVE